MSYEGEGPKMHYRIRNIFNIRLLLGLTGTIVAMLSVDSYFVIDEIEKYIQDQASQVIEACREFKNDLIRNPLQRPDKY